MSRTEPHERTAEEIAAAQKRERRDALNDALKKLDQMTEGLRKLLLAIFDAEALRGRVSATSEAVRISFDALFLPPGEHQSRGTVRYKVNRISPNADLAQEQTVCFITPTDLLSKNTKLRLHNGDPEHITLVPWASIVENERDQQFTLQLLNDAIAAVQLRMDEIVITEANELPQEWTTSTTA